MYTIGLILVLFVLMFFVVWSSSSWFLSLMYSDLIPVHLYPWHEQTRLPSCHESCQHLYMTWLSITLPAITWTSMYNTDYQFHYWSCQNQGLLWPDLPLSYSSWFDIPTTFIALTYAYLTLLLLPQVNFILGQLMALVLAYVMRVYLHPSHVSTTKRHCCSFITGLGISYFCFGRWGPHSTFLWLPFFIRFML